MTVLPIGVAYTLVPDRVYALPAKAVLASLTSDIELSQDGDDWNSVTVDDNYQVALAGMFIKTAYTGNIISLKELGIIAPGSGGSSGSGGAALPTGAVGQVLISKGDGIDPAFSSVITLINYAGDPNLRRWEIKINGTDIQLDSQNDVGVSYGRPLTISLFNGGIQSFGPIVAGGSMGCQTIDIVERPFINLPVGPGVGALANISDSTVNTIGATIAGGGTFHVLARYNGTIWKVIGV